MSRNNRTSAQGENLRAIGNLQEILNEYENAKRGDQKNQRRGAARAQGTKDQPINADPDRTRAQRGKKKPTTGCIPSDIISEYAR